MAAKQQLAPQWASLFRLGKDYYFYSQCQSFIQDFPYGGSAGLAESRLIPRLALRAEDLAVAGESTAPRAANYEPLVLIMRLPSLGDV